MAFYPVVKSSPQIFVVETNPKELFFQKLKREPRKRVDERNSSKPIEMDDLNVEIFGNLSEQPSIVDFHKRGSMSKGHNLIDGNRISLT